MNAHATDETPVSIKSFSWRFVGGEYVETEEGKFRQGHMYVERYEPEVVRHALPVVMWHGGMQTGSNFTATPDGRNGWLHDFLLAGYVVYIVDQPERGRSGHALGEGGPANLLRYDAERIEQRFTGTDHWKLWPQAARHTQWPGNGRMGDPTFDNFFASQVDQLADRDAIEQLNRDAGVALLDEIGDAIVLTHSQSGPFGWLVADARPERVKAIVAIEPNGPPFREVVFEGGPDWFTYAEDTERPYGITRIPMTYEPSVKYTAELAPTLDQSLAGDERVAGYLQAGTPRQLVNLAGIPTLIVTAECSYHATYDHCTSAYLKQAGVEHDFVLLPDRGINGNGHMVMLENNNHEIADVLIAWLDEQGLPKT